MNNLTDAISLVPAPAPDFVGEPLSYAARNAFIVLGVFLMISGTFGNLLVLVTLVKCPSLHSTHYVYVANLASADFIIEAYSSPFVMYDLILGYQPVVNNMHCVFNGFLVVTCYVTSLYTLASISFNRYMHVCQHSLYKRYVTKRLTLFLCAMVWVVSIAVAAGPLLGWGRYSYDVKTHYCGYDRTASISYTATISVGTIALPATAVCYFNFAIFRYVKKAKIKLGKWDKWADAKKGRLSPGVHGDTTTSTTEPCGSDTKETTSSEPLPGGSRQAGLDCPSLGASSAQERQALLRRCAPGLLPGEEVSGKSCSSGTLCSNLKDVIRPGSIQTSVDGAAFSSPEEALLKNNDKFDDVINDEKTDYHVGEASVTLNTNTSGHTLGQAFIDSSFFDRHSIHNQGPVIDNQTPALGSKTRSLDDLGVSNTVFFEYDYEYIHSGVQVVRTDTSDDNIIERGQGVKGQRAEEPEVSEDLLNKDTLVTARSPAHVLRRSHSIPHCLTFARQKAAQEMPSSEPSSVWGVTRRLITSKSQTCPLPGASGHCALGCRDISRPWCLRWKHTRTCSYPTPLCQLCRPGRKSKGAQNGRKTNRRVKERRRKAFALRAAASLDTGKPTKPQTAVSISMKDIHMIKTLLAVFICLVIFMSPYMVTTVMDTTNRWSSLVHLTCSMLAVVNNAINWMLYGLLNKSFRLGYQQVLRSVFKRRRRSPNVS